MRGRDPGHDRCGSGQRVADDHGGRTGPTGQQSTTAGAFGLEADKLNVGGLGGDTYGINLQGQITLPKLKIKVKTGALAQTSCPTEAVAP